MVFSTRAVMAVFKTTGGRLWNKPWGVKKLSATQRENRKKQGTRMKVNSEVLKLAAEVEKAARAAAMAAVKNNP